MDTKDRIHMVMKSQGMTQQEFSSTLGISAASLSNIFTGRTSPTNHHVRAIHKRFPEINVLWLMFGEGEMYGNQEAAPASEPQSDVQHGDVAVKEATSPVEVTQPTLFDAPAESSLSQTPVKEVIKIIDKTPRQRRITEIRIFFDDGTFETFAGHNDIQQ